MRVVTAIGLMIWFHILIFTIINGSNNRFTYKNCFLALIINLLIRYHNNHAILITHILYQLFQKSTQNVAHYFQSDRLNLPALVYFMTNSISLKPRDVVCDPKKVSHYFCLIVSSQHWLGPFINVRARKKLSSLFTCLLIHPSWMNGSGVKMDQYA